MNKKLAKLILTRNGFDVLEQRGFYSHFIRARHTGTYETVGTFDIEDDKVNYTEICNICFRGNPYKEGKEIN